MLSRPYGERFGALPIKQVITMDVIEPAKTKWDSSIMIGPKNPSSWLLLSCSIAIKIEDTRLILNTRQEYM